MAPRTGRSPSGRLRNFAAMSPEKFAQVYTAVMSEQNDLDAITKVTEVNQARKYLDQYLDQYQATGAFVPVVAPEGIDQDVWDTLAALAV